MSKKYNKFLRNRDWLNQQYWGERQTFLQIARRAGCCPSSVRKALRHYGIRIRTYSEALKGIQPTEETKQKISETMKKMMKEMTTREKSNKYGRRGRLHPNYGKKRTKETIAKIREKRKHQKFPTHHTKPELIFEGICEKYNLPFKYTGDSSFWIGKGKDAINPDFMHLRRKVAVEIFSWHHDELNNRQVRQKSRYENRKRIYKKYGYRMIVFWQDDLDREDAEARVLSVLRREKVV